MTEALPYGFAGGLRFLGEILRMNNSYIAWNQGYHGGGILIDGTELEQYLDLDIENCVFIGN